MARDANVIRSFDDLLQVLERDGVPHQTERSEKSVRIPTQHGELDSLLLLRWQDSDGVIQFIQALPLVLTDDKLGLLCEAVTRLNHVMAVPGFDVNHTHRLLSFRLYLPLYPRGEVSLIEVQAMFRLAIKTAADIMPVLAQVLSGQVPVSDIVAATQRHLAAIAAAAAAPPPKPAPPVPKAPGESMY